MTSVRGAIVGCWMVITPGGATPASFMSYGLAKRFSKNGANFGRGELEGVVAPETAAHAAGTSALLPMLTLGIPGSPTAAVLLGGRSEEHTSELQSLMRISYAVFCLKKKTKRQSHTTQ